MGGINLKSSFEMLWALVWVCWGEWDLFGPNWNW
jgi:hypothetical protein